MPRPHQAAGGLHALAHPGGIDADRACVLKNPRAMFFRVGGKAERVIERMNVEGLREVQPLEIVRAAQHLTHLVGRPRLDVRAEIDAQHRGMLEQFRLIVGAADREPPLARLDAGHSGFADAAANVVDAGDGKRPQFLRARQPDAIHDRIDALGESRRHESRIASRRAACDLARLQHRNRPAAPRDLTRDREPGEPATDDADIDIEVVGESRTLRRCDRRRGVPGSWFGHHPLMPRCQGSRKPPGGILSEPGSARCAA